MDLRLLYKMMTVVYGQVTLYMWNCFWYLRKLVWKKCVVCSIKKQTTTWRHHGLEVDKYTVTDVNASQVKISWKPN